MKAIKILLLLLGILGVAQAQNHPELEWQAIETAHFRIFYHQGLERAAARAAEIAERVYGPITRLYGYAPDGKVRIVLKDFDDYANGAAFYYQDTIEIWTTSLEHDFELRGTSDWLSNAIAHEFTHLISLGVARRAPQRMPALYFQYFGYQREKNRPDILIGYPDVLVSYPVMTTTVPMWFAEGVAQYMAPGAHHDRWDSHREMIMRVKVRQGTALSFDEMGVFDKCGFGNEYVYDHGYGLVLYIARLYGEEKLAALARAASRWRTLTFDQAVEQVLGVDVDQLYADWLAALRREYEAQIAALGELREGELIAAQGFSNLRPALSPDGKRLAYLSTRKQHYGPHLLVLRQLDSGEEEILTAGVTSSVSWSPDGQRLYFVRVDRADRYGSKQADIYEFELEGKERGWAANLLWALPSAFSGQAPEDPRVKRLTRGLRAFYPACSPDGEWIAFVRNQGASNNLGLMRRDGSEIRYLTDFADGTQLYTPQWSPDGRRLVLSVARAGQRDIALLPVDFGKVEPASLLEPLVATPGTDRDPVWSPDGREVIFASDVSGIFNLYAIDLETRQVRQLTQVIGGAFHPTVGPQGKAIFAAYGAKGYEIRQVTLEGIAGQPSVWQNPDRKGFALSEAGDRVSATATPGSGAALESRPYDIDFLKTSLLPRLMVDEGRFKGGLYLSSGDALSRQTLFAGAALAPNNQDHDLFALGEYRRWRPTLFLEAYHQKRHSARQDSSAARDLIVTGVEYDLLRLGIGARGHLGRHAELEISAAHDRYDASVKSEAFVPRRDGGLGWERVKQKPFGYTYLKGLDLGLTYRLEKLERRRDQEINPRGRELYCQYDRMFNYFIEGFDQNATFVKEDYLPLFYDQFTLDWKEHLGLPWNTTLSLRFFGGWIASRKVDDPERVRDFFDYHLGGIQYLRGYTFYSVEGRKAAMASATFRFPLATDWGERFLHLYFGKAYAAVYGELGKAWDRRWNDPDPRYGRRGPLRDLGAQLRLDLISYYSVPTRVQLDLAYGLDESADRSPWKFYLTALFGYL